MPRFPFPHIVPGPAPDPKAKLSLQPKYPFHLLIGPGRPELHGLHLRGLASPAESAAAKIDHPDPGMVTLFVEVSGLRGLGIRPECFKTTTLLSTRTTTKKNCHLLCPGSAGAGGCRGPRRTRRQRRPASLAYSAVDLRVWASLCAGTAPQEFCTVSDSGFG